MQTINIDTANYCAECDTVHNSDYIYLQYHK